MTAKSRYESLIEHARNKLWGDKPEEAQVLATLALAEQQRIANLIAWHATHLGPPDADGDRHGVTIRRDFFTTEIDHALDIEDLSEREPE